MSLLDLKWNDIQPELQALVKEINEGRPFEFTRDDVLKSLLLSVGAETRFDRLVSDRKYVEELAEQLPPMMEQVKKAWQQLGCILVDDCRIHSERFFRGGHNSLLPFVLYLTERDSVTESDKRNIVVGIYLAIMSGIFSSAEARLGVFSRRTVTNSSHFPLRDLALLTRRQYGIRSLDDLFKRHLDLALNIAHGGITLDHNPENLQRDHILPRSKLEQSGYPYETVNHYANFHFLRAQDNLNKSDRPPNKWFKNPGRGIAPYSDQDLKDRLLTWDLLEPGNFERMIEVRGKKIRKRAERLFRMSESKFNKLFDEN